MTISAQWPPEKAAKARQLFAASIKVLADALDVAPHEFCAVVLVDPSEWTRAPQPSIEGDVEAMPNPLRHGIPRIDHGRPRVLPTADVVTYRLRSPDGQYLHESCSALTGRAEYAWEGDEAKMGKVLEKYPVARGLTAEKIIHLVGSER